MRERQTAGSDTACWPGCSSLPRRLPGRRSGSMLRSASRSPVCPPPAAQRRHHRRTRMPSALSHGSSRPPPRSWILAALSHGSSRPRPQTTRSENSGPDPPDRACWPPCRVGRSTATRWAGRFDVRMETFPSRQRPRCRSALNEAAESWGSRCRSIRESPFGWVFASTSKTRVDAWKVNGTPTVGFEIRF